jgi:hypothetical protein
MSFSFLGSVVTPSCNTIWPRYHIFFWKYWHFSRLSFRWASWNQITFHRLCRCSQNVRPITITSSRRKRHDSWCQRLWETVFPYNINKSASYSLCRSLFIFRRRMRGDDRAVRLLITPCRCMSLSILSTSAYFAMGSFLEGCWIDQASPVSIRQSALSCKSIFILCEQFQIPYFFIA